MIESEKLRQLAKLIEINGEGMLRATNRQSNVLNWVTDDNLSGI